MDFSNQPTSIVSIRLPDNLKKVIHRIAKADDVSFTDAVISLCNFTIEKGICDDCRRYLLDFASNEYLVQFRKCKETESPE